MNPSFHPPVPISDAVRSQMYADYMLDPETNSVRALSQRYNISLKRVDAILRLKGLEASFVKVCLHFLLHFSPACVPNDDTQSISL
jgi:hypothetical protein